MAGRKAVAGWWARLGPRLRLGVLLVGWQGLSALLAATSILTTGLAHRQLNAPLVQSCGCYILLALLFIPGRLAWPQERPEMALRWWQYALIALADIEGNYCVVLAYRYTDIASATLLDCFAIPCVVGLSMALLHTRYNRRQAGGILCCVAGLVALVIYDLSSDRASGSGGSHKLLGDILVLAGAALYAVSNVSQGALHLPPKLIQLAELIVKSVSPLEFLAQIGGWGSAISAAQIAVLEREQVHHLFCCGSGEVARCPGLP